MKKVLTIIAIASVMAACNNDADTSHSTNDSLVTTAPEPGIEDTTNLGMDTIMPNVDTGMGK